MRSEWVCEETLSHILAALTYENRLACEVSLRTGLRIGDVLALKTRKIFKCGRFTIKEQKTGKPRRIYLPQDLLEKMRNNAGRYFVFENRVDPKKSRTRQAVFKDLKRAARAFRVSENIAPHTMRKAFAVEWFEKTKDLKKVQTLLNHSDEAVTVLYALANCVDNKRKK